MQDFTVWSRDLRVTDDGEGVVSLAGAVPVRLLADRSGLTGSLSTAFARPGFWPVRDRGPVATDIAVAIAVGGRDIVDIEALRGQAEVFGPIISDTTALRALGEIGDGHRARSAGPRPRSSSPTSLTSRLASTSPPTYVPRSSPYDRRAGCRR